MALTSMFNDIGSEMLIPYLPAIIVTLFHGPVIVVGIFLGFSQFLAKATSVYFGNMSDKKGKRKMFIVSGYSISAIMKAMLTTATVWISFVGYYLIERLGKGIRESPRDALLAESEPEKNRGAAFGFRKFFDNAGAIIGPLIALGLFAYLSTTPTTDILKLIILIAVIPSVIAALITLFLKESKKPVKKMGYGLIKNIQMVLGGKDKILYIALFLLALGQFDIGIYILYAQQHITLMFISLIYIAYTTFYTISTMPLGIVTDKFGGKHVLVWTTVLLAFAVILISIAPNLYSFMIFMAIYGIFMAGKRVSTPVLLTHKEETNQYATKIGMSKTIDGIGMLISNVLAGVFWVFQLGNAPIVFPISAVLILVSAFMISKI